MAERTAIWDERPECNKQFNQYVIEVRESTVTNEQIDKLLHALDLRCAGFDPDHYGLPLHSGASDIEELRMIVRRWVRKNIPETV